VKGTRRDDPIVTITNGAAPTTTFNGTGHAPDTDPVTYPSVRAAAWDWAGTRLIILVNDTHQDTVDVQISGLPIGLPPATAIGEARGPISTEGGVISDSLQDEGVHIYKVPLLTQGTSGLWSPIP
jgi:hypothetical protein